MKKYLFIFAVVFALSLIVVPAVYAFQGEIPPSFEITAITLGSIVAALVSLALDYFPGLAAKYDALSVAAKRQIAAVLAVVITAAVFGLTCQKLVTSNLVCSYSGAWNAVADVIYVFMVGQGVHAGTKPTPAFKSETLGIDPKAKGK